MRAKTKILKVLVLMLVVMVPASPTALAAAAPPSGSASGLSISPLRQEIVLNPGQATKLDITLKNITGANIIAKVSVQDFQSDNVSGVPKILNSSTHGPQSIVNFLVHPPDVPLAVGQQKTISVPVQAPNSSAPGAYYGLIVYKAVPGENNTPAGNNKVALSAAVSQIVFITVPGNIVDRVELTAIHVYRDKKATNEGLFFTSPPQSVGVELNNVGNGFAKPFGHVDVKGTTGKVVYSYELNGGIVRSIVLPNSKRIFVNDLKNIKTPGRYTVVASLSYGSGSAILTGKKTFWYLPAWTLVIIAIILAILVTAVWLAYRRYKRSANRRYQS